MFRKNDSDSLTGKELKNLITYDWVQSFMNRFNIVIRRQSGTLLRSNEHLIYTEK